MIAMAAGSGTYLYSTWYLSRFHKGCFFFGFVWDVGLCVVFGGYLSVGSEEGF